MSELVKIPINYLFKNPINISLNKIILVILFLGLIQNIANAQTLPNKIKNYLDANYKTAENGAWKQVPSACDEKKAVLKGDFDGDGQADYLVRFRTGKTTNSMRLFLIAFLNRNGEFKPEPFYEATFTEDLLHSSSIIINKGATINFEENQNFKLKTDAIVQYICETDASKTFVYQDGKIKDIQEIIAQITPQTKSNRTPPTPDNPIQNNPPRSNQPLITGNKMIDEILAAHNKYRAEVGVEPLKWSQTLANSAQKWANELVKTGKFNHSRMGENLWGGSAKQFSYTQMIEGWGDEKKNFIAGVFPKISTTGNWFDVGHYAQIIWKKTTEVGCGLASNEVMEIFVCHYNPPGNIDRQPVF